MVSDIELKTRSTLPLDIDTTDAQVVLGTVEGMLNRVKRIFTATVDFVMRIRDALQLDDFAVFRVASHMPRCVADLSLVVEPSAIWTLSGIRATVVTLEEGCTAEGIVQEMSWGNSFAQCVRTNFLPRLIDFWDTVFTLHSRNEEEKEKGKPSHGLLESFG